MQIMIALSLLLNIVVLVPVCGGLLTDAGWARASYGEATEARAILLSVYLAILMLSAGLLVSRDPKLVAALLLVQVLYKLITPFAVGTLQHPVVISNLAISAIHAVTLWVLWRSG